VNLSPSHRPPRLALRTGVACLFAWSLTLAGGAAEPAPRVAVLAFTRAANVSAEDAQRLQDHLAARLSHQGLQVITRDVALDSLASAGAGAPHELAEAVRSGQGTAALEAQLANETSATRLAETLGAQMVVVAFIDSLGFDRREFRGNERAPGTGATEAHTLRVTYRVCRVGDGASLTGDAVKVSRTMVGNASVGRATDDLLADMTDEAATLIATNVGASSAVRTMPAAAGAIDLKIVVRVQLPGGTPLQLPAYEEEGVTLQPRVDVVADISVDGMVVGTAPATISVSPGPHQIQVAAPGYKQWQRFVKPSAGQRLEIALEMTDTAYASWKDTIEFLRLLSRKTQLDRADAERVRAEAEALRKAHVEVRFDRLDADLDANINHTIRVNP